MARREDDGEPLFWFLMVPFLITIKMSAAVLGLLLLFYAFLVIKKDKRIVKNIYKPVLILSTLLFAPWLLSNILTSGYLVFPFVDLKGFSFQWKLPPAKGLHEQGLINAALVMRYSQIPVEEALKLGKVELFVLWLKDARLMDKLLVLWFVPVALLAVLLNVRKTRMFLLSVVGMVVLLVPMFFAPDLRFIVGTGFGMVMMVIASVPVVAKILKRRVVVYSLVGVQLLVAVILYKHLFNKVLFVTTSPQWFSLVEKIPYQALGYTVTAVDGHTFYVPLNKQYCWDKFPCLLDENPDLRLIGKDFSEGFYEVGSKQ